MKDLTEIELTVTGRKSGRVLPRPVWFALKEKELLLIPVTGTDTEWYKNILQNPQVGIRSTTQTFSGNVRTITQIDKVNEAIELFTKKYGRDDFRKYYPKPDVAASLRIG